MPRYTDDRGDRFERRREDHHSSRHYRGESPPRRSATERRSNETHTYSDRPIPPFRANTSSHARPRGYSFEASNSGYRDTPPGMTRSYTTSSRPNNRPKSPSPEYVYAEPFPSSGRIEYPTCPSPVYEEPSDNQSRRTNSRQQSSHSNTDSADDPTRGIDMKIVALIFVGIAFTFAQTKDLQQKILHMVNFLEYYEVYLSEKEVEDIFHYMYNEREKAKKRFAIPDKDRIKEFERVTGLRTYWVLEGHRRCRTH